MHTHLLRRLISLSGQSKRGSSPSLWSPKAHPWPRYVLSWYAHDFTQSILLGCGSRIWCFDMAKEFSHVEVWGVDQPSAQKGWSEEAPANCRFEVHSNYDFLQDYEKNFDLIHMRFVAGGVSYSSFMVASGWGRFQCSHFLHTLYMIQGCLKPGGLFILIDSTGELLAEDGVSRVPMKSRLHPEGSRLKRLFYGILFMHS